MSTVDSRVLEREERLHQLAREMTGLDDFGEPSYLEAFRIMLAAIVENTLLDDVQPVVDGIFSNVLASRLYSEAGWKAHPEFGSVPIEQPVVIIGVPRTGTTILHNLFALDPRFQVLENWLIDQPLPRPPRDTWPQYPGYKTATVRANADDAAQRRRHHVEPVDPDECIRLMLQTFINNIPGSMLPIPEYDAWAFAQDMRPSFARYKDNLQLISLNDPRTWLLKNPSHVMRIEAMMSVIPDARVIQTHRDPVEAIPSLCSLLAGRRRKLGRSFEPLAIGRRELHNWSEGVMLTDEYRDRTGLRVYDCDYVSLVDRPTEVLREAYAHINLEFTDENEEAVLRYLEENPQGKHGKHEYDATEYGLTAESIRDRFSDYIDRYLPYTR